MFVHRLADGWWGRDVARRATVLFIFFWGSVVFSMVYSEGLLLPLAAICIWAMDRRKWWLAGIGPGSGARCSPSGWCWGRLSGGRAGRALAPRPALTRLPRDLGTADVGPRRRLLHGLPVGWAGNPLATYIARRRG